MKPMLFKQAKHYRKAHRGPSDVTLVCIHSMEFPERVTGAEWCVDFFTDPRGPNGPVVASAHYSVDSDSVAQSVLERDVAYHAGPVNEYSIGIEHAGYAGQTTEQWLDAYSTAMLDRSAKLVAEICHRYGIPVRRLTAENLKAGERLGICGHVDVTNGLQGGKGHTDPGRHFPWGWYLDRVQAHLATDSEATVDTLREPSVVTPELAVGGITSLNYDGFVPVEHDGVTWLVCPIYIAPVGIAEAAELAAHAGCELPTPGLVDAIWRAADLRIPVDIMVRSHDGTPATMNSAAIHAKQATSLDAFIGDRSLGIDYKLLAGAFKDVVRVDGKLALYGWHVDETDPERVAAMKRIGVGTHAPATPGRGRVVQPVFAGHATSWKDYSQAARLVRRA